MFALCLIYSSKCLLSDRRDQNLVEIPALQRYVKTSVQLQAQDGAEEKGVKKI